MSGSFFPFGSKASRFSTGRLWIVPVLWITRTGVDLYGAGPFFRFRFFSPDRTRRVRVIRFPLGYALSESSIPGCPGHGKEAWEMEWFKFRMSWKKPLMRMTKEEAGEVIQALITYLCTGEEPAVESRGEILLCQMIDTMDSDLREYQENAEKKKLHARHAAEARWSRPQDAGCMPECPEHIPENTGCKNQKKKKNQNSETEKEEETDGEGDEEYDYCSEPSPTVPELPVEEIPLNDGGMYPLFRKDVEEYARLYPAVDIGQELRNIRGWCMANPERRKTKRGVNRFINGWLSKAQDKGGRKQEVPENPFLAYARGEKKIGDWIV